MLKSLKYSASTYMFFHGIIKYFHKRGVEGRGGAKSLILGALTTREFGTTFTEYLSTFWM